MASLLSLVLATALTSFGHPAAAPRAGGDWPMFGTGPGRTSVSHVPTGIADPSKLKRRTIALPGTVDSAPISVNGTIVMTTTYGKTVALDAKTGKQRWVYTPSDIGSYEGSSQITNATPAADPDRKSVYTASPDGQIHKLSLATGRVQWSRTITRLPSHEKITSALNVYGKYVIATTGGYVGDAPPYQGHVVTIARSSGRLHAVWNSLCSNVRHLMDPQSCSASDSAIWGRAGAVVDAHAGELYVASSNAPFNGTTNWGDSLLVLSFPDLKLKRNWTPFNQSQLNDEDKDVGSVSPVLLPGGLVLQGGKDARMDLVSRARPNGHGTRPSARTGGQLQTLPLPGNAQVLVTGEPAVDGHRVYVATANATAGYVLRGRRLHRVWEHPNPGTSPVVAGGYVWVYDPTGHLDVYRPGGKQVASLPAGAGHWNAPIVLGGSVWLPEGDANAHARTGSLSRYS